ncbi:MAG TPA: hypothetical protein VNM22_01105 [Candidatus Limnocylindrales bacterium]|nr:hypothetical protein [Candidatus Limnocylindrales bacterium]
MFRSVVQIGLTMVFFLIFNPVIFGLPVLEIVQFKDDRVITTGEKGEVILQYPDGETILIGKGSRLNVKKMRNNTIEMNYSTEKSLSPSQGRETLIR